MNVDIHMQSLGYTLTLTSFTIHHSSLLLTSFLFLLELLRPDSHHQFHVWVQLWIFPGSPEDSLSHFQRFTFAEVLPVQIALYPWSNLCPDWAIFRNVFPANFCLHCGSYMTELNVEKNGDQSEVPHPSSVFLNHFFPSALISAICGPQQRRTFTGNNSKNSSVWAEVVSQT